ncbi:restriction endonuclease subunit S [Nostoc sp.]|uniref:restriction endonuclease subunit S n=1 Tax=Nostoc sp. TaxID=1180 RepID=UPI002FF66AB6
MNELPEGWTLTKFMDVFDIQGGTQPPKSTFQYEPQPGYIQLLQIRDFGEHPVPTYIRDTHTLKKCTEQDILIARYGASLGRILTGLSGAYNVAMAKVYIPEPIHRRFVYYLLISEIFQAPLRLVSRSAQNGFNKQDIAEIELPLAPLKEQKRIADKLDPLLIRLDACRGKLDRIPFILKCFRQSVLAAATFGQLTEDWRTTYFVESEFNNYNISGKLADFADVIDPNPSHRYPSYEGGTIPLLATEQMSGLDGWDISSAKLTTSYFYQARKASHDFLDDDIIFARKGRLGLARNPPTNSRYVFSHTVFIIRAKADKILPAYLLWFLRQEWCIEWLSLEMNSNAGVPTLGKSVMERLPVQIPNYTEQQEIVHRLENLFTYADRLEAHYQAACAKIERLTPVLLAKAFRGELVPQDPNDEPVSSLLERIRTDRAAQLAKANRAMTNRKPAITKMTKESVKETIRQLPKDKFSFDELRENLTGDYDSLKDILFTLLSEAEPILTQVFDQEERAMRFFRSGK